MDAKKAIKKLIEQKKNLQNPIITRFAPSPTGFLHLGHVASAIYVWGIAKVLNAKTILRIEDHDQSRSLIEYEKAIYEDLDWLGFDWDYYPKDSETPSLFRQSDNYDSYVDAIRYLQQKEKLYYCDCSRKKIKEEMQKRGIKSDELCYPALCRNKSLNKEKEAGLRIEFDDKPESFYDIWSEKSISQTPRKQCGDLLLQDRNGNWTYQCAVTIDDYIQKVNLIIRGQDIFSSTGRQIKLARMLGRKDTPLFFHHPLIKNENGYKLSKRQKSESIRQMRHEGMPPEAVIGEALYQVGLAETPKPIPLNAILEIFKKL